MAKLIQDGWCRIEGMVIPDLSEAYGGPFTSIPDNTNIYYGAPEVQIFNKYSLASEIKYKDPVITTALPELIAFSIACL